VFKLGGSQLTNKDSCFKYLGMIFTKTHIMAAAAEKRKEKKNYVGSETTPYID